MESTITDLEYDSNFNLWVGTSPVKVDGKENPIGYWTLKSWRDMSPKKEMKSKENEVRKQFADKKFLEFKRALEAKKMSKSGENISDIDLSGLPEDVQVGIKQEIPLDQVKKITRRKNYGIPSKFYFENKLHLSNEMSEEAMNNLSEELKDMMVFPTRQRSMVRTKILPYLGTGAPSTYWKFATKIADKYLARTTDKMDKLFLNKFDEMVFNKTPEERQEIKKRIENLRRSNPEIISRNLFTVIQNGINWLVIPAAFLGTIKKFTGLTGFLFRLATKMAPALASSVKGLVALYSGCYLGVLILGSLIFKYFHNDHVEKKKKQQRSKKREEPSEYLAFDALAYQVYSGVVIPEDITKHFQDELDFIMLTDSGTEEQRRKSILDLWKRFDLNVRASIEKGIYLRKEEEGAGLTIFDDPDLRSNRRASAKPKVDPFFTKFYLIVKNLEAEEKVEKALTCPNFKDMAKDVMKGKTEIPPQLAKMLATLMALEAKSINQS
jgi:hypothetical protein